MEKRLDRLEGKIDKTLDSIAAIDKTLAAQHVSLLDHIRRTELLEAAIQPLEKRMERVKGVGFFLTFAVTIFGGIGTVLGIASYFKH